MYRTILAFFIVISLLSGCSKPKASSGECTTCTTMSFKTDIIPIFRTNCALSGCHTGNPTTAAGNVSLDSAVAYAQATYPGKGYVNAGSPNSSILYSQLLAGSSNHMPEGSGQLDACTIQKIYCWIEQGAPNN